MGSEIKTYSNFAGADIIVMINDVVFGELQAISYGVSRELAALYTMGSANPRGFAKNKRGLMGTMIFLVFDRDALLSAVQSSKANNYSPTLGFANWGYSASANLYRKSDGGSKELLGYSNMNNMYNPANWNQYYSSLRENGQAITLQDLFSPLSAENIRYVDQIPPFTITISMANEYGAAASMAIYGVQIKNEGSGVSIDDLTTEKTVSFFATDIKPLAPVGSDTQIYTRN